MRDLLPELSIWAANDVRCAIARVVDVDGSAPRQAGAAMAVNESGDIIGSVSGGCVEGEVVAVAGLVDGDPHEGRKTAIRREAHVFEGDEIVD